MLYREKNLEKSTFAKEKAKLEKEVENLKGLVKNQNLLATELKKKLHLSETMLVLFEYVNP